MKGAQQMAKQPTATAFTRSQESWAKHVLDKVQLAIEEREDWLRENGWPVEDFPNDDTLMDLYDDEMFWSRYGLQMAVQREYIREKYL